MFTIIQRMIHIFRTYFGDSEITSGGDEIEDWLNKPQGVLQGNTSGPTIWLELGLRLGLRLRLWLGLGLQGLMEHTIHFHTQILD